MLRRLGVEGLVLIHCALGAAVYQTPLAAGILVGAALGTYGWKLATRRSRKVGEIVDLLVEPFGALRTEQELLVWGLGRLYVWSPAGSKGHAIVQFQTTGTMEPGVTTAEEFVNWCLLREYLDLAKHHDSASEFDRRLKVIKDHCDLLMTACERVFHRHSKRLPDGERGVIIGEIYQALKVIRKDLDTTTMSTWTVSRL